jgi:hypothetical protein
MFVFFSINNTKHTYRLIYYSYYGNIEFFGSFHSKKYLLLTIAGFFILLLYKFIFRRWKGLFKSSLI